MTAAQRYELDAFGFLHLRSALSVPELAAARSAVERLAAAPRGADPLAFAAEPALAALATHAALLPALLELGGGAPRLVGGGLMHDPGAPTLGEADGAEFEARPHRGHGAPASYVAEAPGRCRCDDVVVLPCTEACGPGDGGVLLVRGSHKVAFDRPPGLALRGVDTSSGVPDGLLHLCPRAGDLLLLPAATAHAILPARGRAPPRRRLWLRVEASRARPDAPPSGAVLGRLAAPAAALARGRFEELRALCPRPPAPDPGAVPQPLPEMARPAWRLGRSARVGAAGGAGGVARGGAEAAAAGAPGFAGLSAEQRYLLDAVGFLHLEAVLSPAEVAAARAAFERSNAGRPTAEGSENEGIWEPALEMLATHPKLVPALLELSGGAPHLMLMELLHQPPRMGPPRTVEGGGTTGELHCHRETVASSRVSFETAPPGRVLADNYNVFHYLDAVEPGDGGLGLVPASHKSSFSRPRALFWPYGNHGEDAMFGRDRGDGWAEPDGWDAQRLLSMTADGRSRLRLPDGVLHMTPAAGDVLIVPEATSHCVLPW